MLEIIDLYASIDGKAILQGLDIKLPKGESHVIMGPNGSGKSTLSYVIMGHPNYQITSGDILWEGKSILDLSTDERSRLGIFLSFQHPTEIPGVTVHNFMRNIMQNAQKESFKVREFRKEMQEVMANLQIDKKLAMRYLNDGFSGGEKKRAEILQLTLMKPKLCILDEIDSGLDIDALRLIAQYIEKQRAQERSFLFITHYQRLLNYLSIDKIHIFLKGRIVESGDKNLAVRLEKEGYQEWENSTAQ